MKVWYLWEIKRSMGVREGKMKGGICEIVEGMRLDFEMIESSGRLAL